MARLRRSSRAFAGLYVRSGYRSCRSLMMSAGYGARGFLKRSGTVHFKVRESHPFGLKRDEVERPRSPAINALN
jgi:hypothetical protein